MTTIRELDWRSWVLAVERTEDHLFRQVSSGDAEALDLLSAVTCLKMELLTHGSAPLTVIRRYPEVESLVTQRYVFSHS